MNPGEAQVFGTKKSADTRKVLRFFAERRIRTHFVDVLEKAPSPGELRRFAQKLGVARLLDRDGPRFAELGLRAAQLSDERWLAKLGDEPLLLRLPLVRFGTHLGVGGDEAAWREWVGR